MSVTPQQRREIADKLAAHLIDQGLLIEAGFRSLCMMAFPDAPPNQVLIMRQCFFAGAQHLLGAVMQTLDPGTEPTDADMERMDKINAELEEFLEQFKRQHGLS